MNKDPEFIIHVSERYYWTINLNPQQNECGEFVNRCALIDTKEKKEVAAVNFDTAWLMPMFQNRTMADTQLLARKLKEITDKQGIKITPREAMPLDKRRKVMAKIEKRF